MKRLIGTIVVTSALLAGGIVLAQDPFEVGPNIYKKLAFENDRVRVAEISFSPGDKMGMHSHPDHFVYVLADGKLALSYPDGTTKDFEGKAGDVVWIPAESHAAQNVGTTEFKALVVELKGLPPMEDVPARAAMDTPPTTETVK